MPNNMRGGSIYWNENFAGPFDSTDGVAGRCTYQVASSATFTALSINGGGGRITLAGDDGDAVAVYGPLAFEVDEAIEVEIWMRFRASDADVTSLYFGLTDALTDTVIIEDEDGTLNTVATDAAGLLLEGEQDTTWQTVGVDTDSDKAQTAIGAGTGDITMPDYDVDSDWKTVNLAYTAADSGTMKVWLEDVSGGLVHCATRTSFFDSSLVLAPVISGDDRGSADNIDIAEFGWRGNIGTSFD